MKTETMWKVVGFCGVLMMFAAAAAAWGSALGHG